MKNIVTFINDYHKQLTRYDSKTYIHTDQCISIIAEVVRYLFFDEEASTPYFLFRVPKEDISELSSVMKIGLSLVPKCMRLLPGVGP
jgi:hypothetical protein